MVLFLLLERSKKEIRQKKTLENRKKKFQKIVLIEGEIEYRILFERKLFKK